VDIKIALNREGRTRGWEGYVGLRERERDRK
jgi:hypothetical protein